MSTIKVTNVQNPSAASAAITLDTNGQATLNGLAYPTSGSLSGRNRIINGDMRIDQRNAGASVTVNNTSPPFYGVDRFEALADPGNGVYTVQRSSTAPTGFNNSLLATITTSSTSNGQYNIAQKIEGFNTAGLNFGTANASSVTLSFWVRSSLTGTFAGGLSNSAGDRSYVFTYSISAANTWEQKSVTIPGDTTGTWLSDNGIGIRVIFNLGSGTGQQAAAGSWTGSYAYATSGAVRLISTLNATFYITGVQLEAGSVATPFERRSYGQELALCQRYYQARTGMTIQAYSSTSFYAAQDIGFAVTMRAAPNVILTNGTSSNLTATSVTTPSTSGFGFALAPTVTGMCAVGSGQNAGYTASAEL